MVLSELGSRIASSLSKLSTTPSIGEEAVKSSVQEICRALLESDVKASMVMELRREVLDATKDKIEEGVDVARLVDRAVFKALVNMIDPGKKPFRPSKRKQNVIMFVGLQGAGKTTTIAKVANHYKRRGFKVAMVCADTFRAGAYHQLVQNAQKVRVPHYGDEVETDPVRVAREGVEVFKREKFEVILVDTSGRHKQESALFAEMQDVAAAVEPDEVIFVMDASIGQSAYDQASAFQEAIDVGSVIITKLDGHAKGGGALSAVAATGSPITFYGTGERFDDLEEFDAPSFVSKLLGRGDLKGLMRNLTSVVDEKEQEKMMKSMAKGKITLRDFRSQFEMVSRMGPMNKILGMVPGMSQMMQNLPDGADGADNIKRFMVILDSMSNKELDGIVPMDMTRVRRIARGAGVHPGEVAQLLALHRQLATMFGKMSKAGLIKTDAASEAKMMQQLKRDPRAIRNKLAQSMDPAIARQFGGIDGMMNLMQQIGGGGGPAAPGGGGGMEGLMQMAQSMMGGGGMPGGMPGGPGGPDLAAMMAAMRGRGRGGRRIIRGRK